MDLLSSTLGIIVVFFCVANGAEITFDSNYQITWGYDHVFYFSQGTKIQLLLDNSSGAGFESKSGYGSGVFHLKIKVPPKDSAGVVTAFYLTSKGDNHDELDFEFLGNSEGKPTTLQTNMYVNGLGDREQRLSLWFDPTTDYHDYKIIWNQHQIVFFVDDIPIRVVENNGQIGVNYPSHSMQVEASIWDESAWATDGGKTKINWDHAPFKAYFAGFDTNGCTIQLGSTDLSPCSSPDLWWNSEKYWKLDDTQQKAYENVKNNFYIYDYCNDSSRWITLPPECPH